MVTCPRCGRESQLDNVWVWINGQGERLQIENGRIQQSGHVTVFDLACGCRFDTTLWRLVVTASASLQRGHSVTARITANYLPDDNPPGWPAIAAKEQP